MNWAHLLSKIPDLAAIIAAIFAVTTYQLSRKMLKFSLFDKRYAIFKSFIELIAELKDQQTQGEIYPEDKDSLDNNPSLQEYFFSQFYLLSEEAAYLFKNNVASVIRDGINYFEPPESLPISGIQIPSHKSPETLHDYLKKITDETFINNLFGPYLLDKEFKEQEPYSMYKCIKNLFGC